MDIPRSVHTTRTRILVGIQKERVSGNPGDAQYYENHYWLGTGYVADTSSRNMYRYTPGGRDATPRNGVYGEKVEHIPDPSNQ